MPDPEDEVEEIIKAWKPPSPDRSTWTTLDFLIEGIKYPVPFCFCGSYLMREDRYCEDCGLKNPSFDEDQYKLLWGDGLEAGCRSEHKRFITDIRSGKAKALNFCAQCGQPLFGPRLVK